MLFALTLEGKKRILNIKGATWKLPDLLLQAIGEQP